MIRLHEYCAQVKLWLKTYKNRLILAISYFLVALLCFEAGWLKKSLAEVEPVQVEIKSTPQESLQDNSSLNQSVPVHESGQASLEQASSEFTDCPWVGSKKSNKYHHPQSRCAKQIKPENRICFASREAAEEKRYVSGCLE